MNKKLPFSIIHRDINIDFNFQLHDQTTDSKNVGYLASVLINKLDEELKKKNTSEGDLIQALGLFIATRVVTNSFEDKKILDFFSSVLEKTISEIRKGQKTKIGNC
ncbi:MAG: hypothetical protein ACJ0GH_04425 [Alphaproteobacteria bacterium]|tara:strand:+ start:108 stop:425 length:318 start_codon:yes stop_codon:yes gene_type:complete